LVAVIILQHWQLNEYAITPGGATPVAPLVKVHGVATNPHHDRILLTDVYLSPVSVFQWLTLQFQHPVEFVTPDQLLEPGVPADELNAQGFLQMSDSKQAAEVAALRALGWKVPFEPAGAVITAVIAPSPARTARLHVGDEVVGVNKVPVRNGCDFVRAVHGLAPATTVELAVRPVTISRLGVLSWGKVVTRSLTTTRAPKGLVAPGCASISGPGRSYVGVALEDGRRYRLPATISINTANIGGPSAGLAMTLALMDRLSHGSLTGGHVVAATGTMSPNGVVGDVGGVAEKTVAVQRAGAQYFLVPQVEVATARANAAPGLTVLGVTSLAQALKDLRDLGGAAPVALTPPS
jgi:PDZ domain-containing protein